MPWIVETFIAEFLMQCNGIVIVLIVELWSTLQAMSIHTVPQMYYTYIFSTITASTRCNVADIIFVLDSSGSIGADNWQLVLNFTKSVALGFEIGPQNVQIGVNYYGNSAQVAFNLNT